MDNKYTTEVSPNIYVDFTIEVIELDGPDYNFEANDIQLIITDEEGFETPFELSSLDHDGQQSLIQTANDAIDAYISDNSEKLLERHADPEFLQRLDAANEYNVPYLH
jgi:hypothetical protein